MIEIQELLKLLYAATQEINTSYLELKIIPVEQERSIYVSLNDVDIITVLKQDDSIIMEACSSIDKNLTFGNSMIYRRALPDTDFLIDFSRVLSEILSSYKSLELMASKELIIHLTPNVFIKELRDGVKLKIELTSKGFKTFLVLKKSSLELHEEELIVINEICKSLDSPIILDSRLLNYSDNKIEEIRSFR